MNAEGNLGRTDGLKARNVRPLIRIISKCFCINKSILVAVATASLVVKQLSLSPTIRENRGVFILNIFKPYNMRYKANSCHDCLFSTICDNPKKNPDGGYRCSMYQWKYQ